MLLFQNALGVEVFLLIGSFLLLLFIFLFFQKKYSKIIKRYIEKKQDLLNKSTLNKKLDAKFLIPIHNEIHNIENTEEKFFQHLDNLVISLLAFFLILGIDLIFHYVQIQIPSLNFRTILIIAFVISVVSFFSFLWKIAEDFIEMYPFDKNKTPTPHRKP